jgi:ubiquinone/menaquinone biosynthesis C-methylase UbiE
MMRHADALKPADEPQEDVACPLCGSRAPELVMHAEDRLFGRPGTYRIVRCADCSLKYLSPRPTLEGLGAHYPDDYFIYRTEEEMSPLLRLLMRRLTEQRWSSYIARFERVRGRLAPNTKIVDVGCGMNDLLAALATRRGCQGVGVDFNPKVVEYVREKRKMPVYQGTLHDGRFADGEFDVVTMNEYLEHEPDPRGVLAEARRITKRGGHLAVEVPFSDCLPARVFGSRWSQLDAPRHLTHFTRETLSDMLSRSGFRMVHVKTFQIPMLIGMSVVQALGHKKLGRASFFDRWLVSVAAMPFLPFFPLLDEFMFVVAQAE